MSSAEEKMEVRTVMTEEEKEKYMALDVQAEIQMEIRVIQLRGE